MDDPNLILLRLLDTLRSGDREASYEPAEQLLQGLAEGKPLPADPRLTATAADAYVIWSHEHRAWWRPGGIGYTPRLADAGRFTRLHAIDICIRAMPGAKEALNELPVRLADLTEMLNAYRRRFSDCVEAWM